MSVFEAIMLICFGAAWPFSIIRSYRAKSNMGKSLVFMIVVEVGYISGMIHKVIYNFDPVFYLYALNAALVMIDLALYRRNAVLKRGEC